MVATLVVVISVRELSFSFPTRPIFKNISFSVGEGKVLGVLGASGVGKSTLLRLLAGLLGPFNGEVRIGDLTPAEALIRGGIGFMFQRDMLLDWLTATENVALALERQSLPKEEKEQRCRELLARVGLSDIGDCFPHELSGGMRQRVALCRGIATSPKLMLLDEPFASVDMLTREEIMFWLRDVLSGTQTSVLVTHHVEEAVFLSDRVIVLAGNPARIVGDLEIAINRADKDVLVSDPFVRATAQLRAALRAGGAL